MHLRAALIGLVLIVGCDGTNPPANSGQIVSALSTAKGSCERLAAKAKSHVFVLPQRRQNGIDRYEAARTASNSFIRGLIASVGPTAQVKTMQEIESDLQDIDAKCHAFERWYSREPDGPTMAESAEAYGGPSLGIGEITGLAKSVVELIAANKRISEEERQRVVSQLEECKWLAWKDIR